MNGVFDRHSLSSGLQQNFYSAIQSSINHNRAVDLNNPYALPPATAYNSQYQQNCTPKIAIRERMFEQTQSANGHNNSYKAGNYSAVNVGGLGTMIPSDLPPQIPYAMGYPQSANRFDSPYRPYKDRETFHYKDKGLRYPRPDLEWEPDPVPTGFEDYKNRWSDVSTPISKMKGWGPKPKIEFDPLLMWESKEYINSTEGWWNRDTSVKYEAVKLPVDSIWDRRSEVWAPPEKGYREVRTLNKNVVGTVKRSASPGAPEHAIKRKCDHEFGQAGQKQSDPTLWANPHQKVHYNPRFLGTNNMNGPSSAPPVAPPTFPLNYQEEAWTSRQGISSLRQPQYNQDYNALQQEQLLQMQYQQMQGRMNDVAIQRMGMLRNQDDSLSWSDRQVMGNAIGNDLWGHFSGRY